MDLRPEELQLHFEAYLITIHHHTLKGCGQVSWSAHFRWKYGSRKKHSHVCLGSGFRDCFLLAPSSVSDPALPLPVRNNTEVNQVGCSHFSLMSQCHSLTKIIRSKPSGSDGNERLWWSELGKEAITYWPRYSSVLRKILKTQMCIMKEWQWKSASHTENSQLRDPRSGLAKLEFVDSIPAWSWGSVCQFYGFQHFLWLLSLQIYAAFKKQAKDTPMTTEKNIRNVILGGSVVHLIKNPVTLIWDIEGRILLTVIALLSTYPTNTKSTHDCSREWCL